MKRIDKPLTVVVTLTPHEHGKAAHLRTDRAATMQEILLAALTIIDSVQRVAKRTGDALPNGVLIAHEALLVATQTGDTTLMRMGDPLPDTTRRADL